METNPSPQLAAPTVEAVVRICRKCAITKDGYWYLFCNAKSPYDHATTKPCSLCGNIRFTAKINNPNHKVSRDGDGGRS